MIDTCIYSITSNGYRQRSLTRIGAIDLARRLNKQMRIAGWEGRARVWYRDGSEVIYTDGLWG